MMLDIKTAIKSIRFQLALSFCVLVTLKILLSLRFHSPWIFPDEAIYVRMAADILGSNHSSLPPAYPAVISIAYLFSDDKMAVYHMILLINSLLSSLIIFPSYFILNKYCPDDFSFMGALTIAVLPSLSLYSFVIMTENLFTPLFIFSLWFLLEAYENNKLPWIILAITSAFLLFFSRHNGIFLLVAMAVSVAYYLLSGRRPGHLLSKLSNRIIIAFIIFLVALFASMKLFTLSEPDSYLNWLHQRTVTDGQLILLVLTDTGHLQHYLSLLQNEVAYLMINSYFIFFYIAFIFLLGIFLSGLPGGKRVQISSLASSRKTGLIAFNSCGIYFISASVIFLFMATVSLYKMEQAVYGRYIDPIIPGLFLYGLVGLYQIHNGKKNPDFGKLSVMGILITAIFFYNFPLLMAEEFPLLYANPLRDLAPNWIVFPALSAVFFLLLNVYKCLKDNWRIFFIMIISFSVCASAYSYYADLLYQSDRYRDMNQIGLYLNENSSRNSLIIMDDDIPKSDWQFDSLTSFWAKRNLEYATINDELLHQLERGREDTYIVTSKVLPLGPLVCSRNGYYLYMYSPGKCFYGTVFHPE